MNSLTEKQIYDLNNMNVAAQNIELGNVVNTLIVEGGGDGGNSGGESGGNEEKNSGKRTCRFTIGTSTSGWTEGDCDYLCDGIDDQVEINQALSDLPDTGGEIIILDGIYNITAPITIAKNSTTLSGNGNSTILKRMWDSSAEEGIIYVYVKDRCIIQNLFLDGNKGKFTSIYNFGICLSSSRECSIINNYFRDNYYAIRTQSGSHHTITDNFIYYNYIGMSLRATSNCKVIGNTCNNNSNTGIYIDTTNFIVISGNMCNNNTVSGIGTYSGSGNIISSNSCSGNKNGINISDVGNKNITVTGNTCNDNKENGINLYITNNSILNGNFCYNNEIYGIHLTATSKSTIVGNTCIRGTGLASDYTSTQYSIYLQGASNYNLIAYNNIMGKNYVADGGTGNTFTGNKYN